MNVKEFFTKIKVVYLEVTKEQRDAKNKIAQLEKLCNDLDYVRESLNKVKNYLDDCYLYLPNNTRQSIIQSTLDFLIYGKEYKQIWFEHNFRIVKDDVPDNRSGYIVSLSCFIDDLKHILDLMRDYYKRGEYKLICDSYAHAKELINKFKEKYYIKNQDFDLDFNLE